MIKIIELLQVLGDAVDESTKSVLPGVLDVTGESTAHFLLEDFDDDAAKLLRHSIIKFLNEILSRTF